nr:unnamed protein product [Digitaria exilis]
MSGKGKRRSARLLKLEEKNDGDSAGVCLLDPWQIIRNSISGSSTRGKRKRNEEIQVTDYAERVSRPGDFATLRQKNKDGMYTALEQFEAMSLLDQAKQVFMSLKNNQMYSVTELAAWRQRHLDQLHQQAITPEGREGGNRGPPRHVAAMPSQPSAATPRKKSTAETRKQENANTVTGGNTPANQRARRRGPNKESKGTPPGKRARRATTASVGRAGVVTRRRLTYNGGAGADRVWRAMAMPVFQGQHVTFNSQPHEQTYRDSLHGFVRHAGLKARVAAEFRTLECVSRTRRSPVPQCSNGFAPGAGFLPPSSPRLLAGAAVEAIPARPPAAPAGGEAAAAPECKLETDEVLKLFLLMGTPAAFLERAKKMFGEGEREESARKEEGGQVAMVSDEARAGAAVADSTGQKSGASEAAGSTAACGPFAPPKLVPGRLGFGQFAGSSAQPFKMKPKPSTASNAAGKKKIS